MRLNANVPDLLYFAYRDLVGVGNMSSDLQEYISLKLKIPKEQNELQIKLNKINKDIAQSNILKQVLEADIKKFNQKQELIKEKLSSEMQEKLSFDPFAHLEKGRGRNNAAGRMLYRIENGKFIPEWAIKRNPDDPKGFAIKVLSKILRNSEV